MNLLTYLSNRIALAAKERELRKVREFLFVLRDQVQSGQVAVRRYEAKEKQIEAEIFALESPDEIVRRGQQA